MNEFERIRNNLLGGSTQGGGSSSSQGSADQQTARNEFEKIRNNFLGGSTGQQAARNEFERVRNQLLNNQTIDTDYVNKFITDVNDFFDGTENEYGKLGVKNAAQVYGAYAQRFTDLNRRSDIVLNYLSRNRDTIGEEEYQKLSKQIKDAQGVMLDNLNAFRDAKNYYTQWETEEDYKTALQEYEWLQKYQEMDAGSVYDSMASLEDGAEKQWLSTYAGTLKGVRSTAKEQADAAGKAHADFLQSEEYTSVQTAKRLQQMYGARGLPFLSGYSAAEEIALNKREKELRTKAEQLRSQANQYKMEELMADIDNVAAAAEQEYQDYIHSEEYVAWSQTKEQERNERVAMANSMGINPDYMVLFSHMEEDPKEKELRGLAEYYRNLATSKREGEMMQADLDELASWSKEEQEALMLYATNRNRDATLPVELVGIRGFQTAEDEAKPLIEKYGIQKVREIAESYMRSQNQEAAGMITAKAQEGAGSGFWAGVGHSVASVGANLVGSAISPLGYLVEGAQRTGRYSTLDPNNAGQLPGTYAGAVRQEVAGNIEEAGFGKGGSTVYQAAMSSLDNLARLVAGGKTGSLALAASGSFGQAVSQYSNQGADPLEAVGMGIINASLEVLTEKVSLDNLLDEMAEPKDILQMLKAAFIAGGVEVSEEELSFLGSTLAEAAVLREKSAYNRRVAELQAYGLTNGQAREQASLGVIEEAAQTAIQSFLSGSMMSGATSVYSNTVNRLQNRAAQKQLQGTVQEAAKQIQEGDNQEGQITGLLSPDAGRVTIAEGAQIDPEVQAEVQRIADFTGRKIEFYTEQNNGEEGFYDVNTGVIHVYANGKNPVAQVVSHELTHSVEMASAYKEISSLVMQRIKATGVNIEQLRQTKRDLYTKNGQMLADNDAVDKEIVASYVAEHLLTNEQEITTLTREKPGLARRILDWLDGLLAKFGNSGAQERLFIRKARDAYSKALVQTGATLSVEQGGGIRNMKQDWERAKQDYSEGRITDEEFEAASDDYHHRAASFGIDVMAKEDQRFAKKDDGKQFSLAEENAETADASNIQNKIDSEFEETSDIDLEQDASEYPYDMQTVLSDYMDAVDDDALEFIEDVQNGKAWQGKKITVGIASSRMVEDIAQLTGVENQAGCKIMLNTNAVRHIQNRHGENGEHDNTMRDNRDIARMDYVLQNYDSMEISPRKNYEYKNRDGSASQNVIISKKINGTYFVIEAVPNTGKIGIVSAYMNKNGASQVPDTKAPSRNVQNELASTPTDIVSDGSVGVNRKNLTDNSEDKNRASQVPDDNAPGSDVRNVLASATDDRVADGDGGVKRQYSISDPEGEQQSDNRKELTREDLPAKARRILESSERFLLNHIGNALGVPYHAKRDTLKPIIQEISNEYLRTGTVSDETVNRLFDEAYEAGVVIDREFFDQYKHIKDHLRTTSVTISQQDQADIADFKDFRKRAWGTLRIVKEGGLPVDSAYHELQEMAPELFPVSITHPADQLQRMFDVGRSIRVSESSLDSYYGKYAPEYKTWQKNDFAAAINESISDLRTVKRYADDRIAEMEENEEITLEQAEQLWVSLKDARRNYEKVNAKNLLSRQDEMQVGRLLRGEILLEHLENEENFKSIRAVFLAKQEYEAINSQISKYKRQIRAKRLQQADGYLETAITWKDKRTGIAYSRETMRRNVFDIIPDNPELANRIVEEYFEPVHSAEAKSTRFKTEYRERVKALDLSRKVEKGNEVSEAHAVQLLGEAMDNIRIMEASRGRMKSRDGYTLRDWQLTVDALWHNNPNLDRAKIENAVQEFRKIYDELFQKMNRVRMENGYEPVNYRKGYFPHFRPGDGDGIIQYFGKVLGIDTNVEALPTTINGLTHTFKPGIQWFGNAQERTGFKTAYDAVEGFDKYIEGVSSVIHQTENIQKLRALGTQARYRTSDEGLREQVDAVQRDPRLTDEERQMKIREIYEHGKYTLSNFVAELDEYTNLLANKKSRFDRTMESMMGRRAYTIMKNVESRVGANMIAGNLSSAFTNFIPLTQALGRVSSTNLLKGMKDARRAIIGGTNSIVGQSDFLTNRRGSDVLVKGWSDKLSNVLGMPMELIDNYVSESIVRASYYQNLRQGMSESEAMHQADIFAASVMADRSKGSMPTLFESSNPLFKAFTQFQLEVNNQYSEIFKDIPREYADKAKWVLAAAFMKYFIAAFLYNELEEKIKGRRSALDPRNIAMEFIDDMRTEGIGEAGANLTVNLLEGVPFSSALAMVGVEIDGGRVPVSSAMPDIPALWGAMTDKDMSSAERWKTLGDEMAKPVTYLLMPAGGNQASKMWKGIDAYIKGGSYGLDQGGNEILQYPVYKDDGGDAFWNLVRSMVFGKNSLDTAQDWVEGGFDSLDKYQTVVYQDMLEAGVKDRDAYELVDGIRNVPQAPKGVGEEYRRRQQQELILSSDISDEGKAIAFYGMVATEREQNLLNALTDAGAGEDILEFVIDFDDAKALEGDERRAALKDAIMSHSLTEMEKQVAIGNFLGTEEVTEKGSLTLYGKFLYAKDKGLSADEFMEMYAMDADVEDYLDMVEAGTSSDAAFKLAKDLGALDTTGLSSTEKWRLECDVILSAGLQSKDEVAALENVSYESTGRMIRIGYEYGIEPSVSVDFKRILPDFDANNNGSYSQKEVTAAIDAIAGNEVFLALTGGTAKLTNEQKAVLWQLQTNAKDGKSNPYDKEIGKLIYDMVQAQKDAAKAEKEAEETETDSQVKEGSFFETMILPQMGR